MKKIFNFKSLGTVFVFLIIGGLVATTTYFYNEYQKIKKNPELISQEEVKTITDNISRFMELPTDEEPSVATITDQEKLKDQDFFKKAQNGDKILIYTKSAKAILYRPSSNRVIEFAPLFIDSSMEASAEQQINQEENFSVTLYNGTTISGLTSEYEQKLVGYTDLSITNRTNATRTDYTENLIFVANEAARNIALQMGQDIDARIVDSLPAGEAKPETDILVIVGKEL